MATTKKKISVLVPEQLPDFIKSDHPDFVNFLKTYYEFLESAELKLKTLGNNDSILNEEGTTTYILLEDDNPYRKNEKNTIILQDYEEISNGVLVTTTGDGTVTRTRTAGSFINGEVVTGQTSKATATIRAEDINDNSRIFISAQNKFLLDEQIIGATSNASAYIESYTANPVQNVSDLLEYADVDDTIDAFFEQFKDSFMRTIPKKLATDVTITDAAADTRLVNLDQRNILKNIKDLYRAKGSRRGHEIFFRLLLGENVELFYPNTNMLRVSDGKFEDPTTLRIIQVNDVILMENDNNQQIYMSMENGEHILQEDSIPLALDMNKLVGETITQDAASDLTILEGQPHHPNTTVANGFAANFVANVPTGGYTLIEKATASVELVTEIQLGSVVLFDLTLTEGSVVGTFLPGQRIYGQDNTNADRTIYGKNTSMLSSITLASTGQYFATADSLTHTSDVGVGAQLDIEAVSAGKISNIDISSAGTGYEIGDIVTVSDTATGGTGLSAEVSVVSGGIAPETGSLVEQFRFTTESGTAGYPGELITEDTVPLYFNQEEDYGMVATDHFVLEDQTVISDNTPGIKVVQERASGTGDITDVRIKGIGNNYTSLPTLTLPTTSTLRVRASRIIAEDADYIITEDGSTMMLESNVTFTQTTFSKTTTGNIAQTSNVLVPFTVGETIAPPAPSTVTGTVVKVYDDPLVPDHSFIEYTVATGVIAAGNTITGATSGSNADVLTVKNRASGKIIARGDGTVGKITSARVLEPGVHYTEVPALTTVTNILVNAPTAALVGDRTITGGTSGATATIVSYDTDVQLIKASSVTGTFVADETITESTSGTTATITSVDAATFTSNVGATAVFGKYINEDGFISDDSKVIQDSLYWQDFSYVVKTATSITVWKDELLATAHPSGFALFSQINPVTIPPLNLRIKTSSTVPDLADARASFTPDLLSTLKTIFTTQLGRRLGGTAQTLSSAPLVGVPSGTALSNDKDVSLTHHILIDRYSVSHERALRGTGDAITYPTVTIAASTGPSAFIGDGGTIRKNFDIFKFSNSYKLAADNPSILFRSHPGFYEQREITTLDGAINDSVTTITLTSAAQFPTAGTIVIGSEQITYTGKSSNNLTGCTRGANIQGTTSAAAHADDVNVFNFKFIVTENTGTSGTYHPSNWSEFTIGDITDLPGAKHNIPAPSEITLTVT